MSAPGVGHRDGGAVYWGLVALVAVLSLPGMTLEPWGGLDGSWIVGMNLAWLMNLGHGSEVLFTYGPLSALTLNLTIDRAVWLSSVFLEGLVYMLLVVESATYVRSLGAGWGLNLLFIGALGIFVRADNFEYAGPVAVAFMFMNALGGAGGHGPGRMRTFAAIPLTLAVSAMPKHNAALMCAYLLVVMAGVLCMRGALVEALVLVLASLGCFLGLWVLIGQDPAGLPAYLEGIYWIARGYEAMASEGPLWQGAAGLAGVAVLVGYTLSATARGVAGAFVLAAILAGPVFMSLRHGFTRQDPGHTGIYFVMAMLSISALLAHEGRRRMRGWALGGVALSMSCGVISLYLLAPSYLPGNSFLARLPDAVRRVTVRRYWDGMERGYKERLREAAPLAPEVLEAISGDETVDIYPHEASLVYTYGLDWSPRPVFQAYQAYNAYLAGLNAAHYLGPRAPSRVLYSLDTIDGRYALFDEPATLLAMLRAYEPLVAHGRHIVLGPRPGGALQGPRLVGRARGLMGGRLTLPEVRDRYLLARVMIHKTALGRLRGVTYRPPLLYISFYTPQGEFIARHRFIEGAAEGAGLYVGTYVSTTEEALGLLMGRPDLAGPEVGGMEIEAPAGGPYFEHEYEVEFLALDR